MNDAIVAWKASPSGTVTGYHITWLFNGTALPAITVPRTGALDATSYSLDFNNSNPSVTIEGGDVIDVTVVAIDATHGLASPGVTPPAVTEPVLPPADAQSVTLTLA